MSEIASRRLDEKERRREEILDAAEEVMRDKGFDAAKMEDVAKRARVSRALIYLYFKNKSELHFGIGLRALDLLRSRFQQARTRHKIGVDQVNAIGRAYVGFAQEFPVYFQALCRFEGHYAEVGDSSLQQRLMMAAQLVHAETIAALMNGQKDGSIRKDLNEHVRVSMTLWGFMHGVAQLAMTKGEFFVHAGIALSDFIDGAVAMATRAVRS